MSAKIEIISTNIVSSKSFSDFESQTKLHQTTLNRWCQIYFSTINIRSMEHQITDIAIVTIITYEPVD